jgi:hypothetical protein
MFYASQTADPSPSNRPIPRNDNYAWTHPACWCSRPLGDVAEGQGLAVAVMPIAHHFSSRRRVPSDAANHQDRRRHEECGFSTRTPTTGRDLSSIFVTGLQGEQGTITATTYPLTNELNGISVWVDSFPAPILAIAFLDCYQQINVQVPWEDPNPKGVQVAQNSVQAQTTGAGRPLVPIFRN